ncbi:MAG: hypothetical protein RM022_011860 [Nostoc sp. EfeVER01]|nr:hypothetical protein [Nostoc sp. EfeVER01]MDZ7946500.1 hypothetical protein [Nostoc sp. EfeVER01]
MRLVDSDGGKRVCVLLLRSKATLLASVFDTLRERRERFDSDS